MVACSILTALLNEYSSTNRSSSVGLSWEFHSQCKMTFEVILQILIVNHSPLLLIVQFMFLCMYINIYITLYI